MPETISCTINGEPRSFESAEDTPLLFVLRETLGLKAARFGCGEESCGVCTVIVDGAPRYSCTLAAREAQGTEIVTAEALAGSGGDHPLLTAFLDHQAGQCGYCLPGILMRALAHIDSGGATDRDSVAQALDANLCRCGAHQRILDAVTDAAQRMRADA